MWYDGKSVAYRQQYKLKFSYPPPLLKNRDFVVCMKRLFNRKFGNTCSIHHYVNAIYMAPDICELENKKVKPIVFCIIFLRLKFALWRVKLDSYRVPSIATTGGPLHHFCCLYTYISWNDVWNIHHFKVRAFTFSVKSIILPRIWTYQVWNLFDFYWDQISVHCCWFSLDFARLDPDIIVHDCVYIAPTELKQALLWKTGQRGTGTGFSWSIPVLPCWHHCATVPVLYMTFIYVLSTLCALQSWYSTASLNDTTIHCKTWVSESGFAED